MRTPHRVTGQTQVPQAPQARVAARAPATAFTIPGMEQVGNALDQASTSLLNDVGRQRESDMAVARATSLSAYNEQSFQELNRMQLEEDFSNPDTVGKFNSFLEQRKQETLLQHQGTDESRARLAERLEGVRTNMYTEAVGAGFKAMKARTNRVLGEQINTITATAAQSPERMQEHFASWDAAVDDMAPGLTFEEEAAMKASGRAQIVASAFNTAMKAGPSAMVSTGAILDNLGYDDTVKKIALAESGNRQLNADGSPVTSSAGAVGVMQLMPGAAQEAAAELGVSYDAERLKSDENYNRTLGETYYRMQLEAFGGNTVLALSAYNAGPGNTKFYENKTKEKFGKNYTPSQFISTVEEVQKRVMQSRGEAPTSQTANYIRKILGGGTKQRFGAEDILNLPGIDAYLPPEQRRQMQNAVIKLELEQERWYTEAREEMAQLEFFNGGSLNASQRAAFMNSKLGISNNGKQDKTFSDAINEYQTVFGAQPEGEVLERMKEKYFYGKVLSEEGGAFGSSLSGRALNVMNNLAPIIESGSFSTEQVQQWQTALTEYTQPRTRVDEFGKVETITPQLPPFVIEAQKMLDAAVPEGQQIEQRQGAYLEQNIPPVPEGQQVEGQQGAALKAYLDGQAPPPQTPVSESAPADMTVFELVKNELVTGPISAAQEALGRTPVVGGLFENAAVTRARNFIPLIQRDLIRVLQNNPRYAEGERQAIEAEISISPSIWDRPESFINRMIAVEDALEARLATAQKTAVSRTVGPEERVNAGNIANGIVHFLTRLGMPSRVATAKDWEGLAPGAVYIDPNYNIKVKRQVSEETTDAN